MKKKPNPHASALGKIGGHKRAQRLTAARRSEIARMGGVARWAKARAKQVAA